MDSGTAAPLSKAASVTLLDFGRNSLTVGEDITAVVPAVNKLPAGAKVRPEQGGPSDLLTA